MEDLVKTLTLIAQVIIKENHKVLDNKMTADQQIEFVNSVNTLLVHSNHIQHQVN